MARQLTKLQQDLLVYLHETPGGKEALRASGATRRTLRLRGYIIEELAGRWVLTASGELEALRIWWRRQRKGGA